MNEWMNVIKPYSRRVITKSKNFGHFHVFDDSSGDLQHLYQTFRSIRTNAFRIPFEHMWADNWNDVNYTKIQPAATELRPVWPIFHLFWRSLMRSAASVSGVKVQKDQRFSDLFKTQTEDIKDVNLTNIQPAVTELCSVMSHGSLRFGYDLHVLKVDSSHVQLPLKHFWLRLNDQILVSIVG